MTTEDGNGTGGDVATSEIEAALERIRKRVAERRESGELPPGLEDELDRHYRDVVSQMVSEQRIVASLKDAVKALDGAPAFSRSRIHYDSRSLLGRVFHRVWGKLSARQTDGVLLQLTEFATRVRRVVDRMSDVVEGLAVHGHPDTERRLTTAADRLSLVEQRLGELEARVVAASPRDTTT